MNNWFSDLIDNIKVDHFLLQTNSAPPEKAEFYQALMSRDDASILGQMRDMSSQYFIKILLRDYLNELKAAGKLPRKLAMALSDSKILVWSEIEDGDEWMEDLLLLTEAKINGKYHPQGFYINSTIIERSDSAPIPPHYQTIIE